MRHTEAQSQRAVLKWWCYACHALKCPEFLLFSIPNGGYRRTREAALLKLEGCRAGAPDLLLLSPRAGHHGMVLEMKAQEGKVSEEQKTFLGELIVQGYKVVIAHSTEEAIQAITNYLRGKSNETASAAPQIERVLRPSRPSPPPPSVSTAGFSVQPERRVADVKPPYA